MATQFEFRLLGGAAPEGELDADQLLALVQGLKDVALSVGRVELDAQMVGRPSRRTQHLARLSIGLEAGSTRLLVRRADVDDAALPIELEEEQAFDATFRQIIEDLASDVRPAAMSDATAGTVGRLRAALASAASKVEFSVDGGAVVAFDTAHTRASTWQSADQTLGDQRIRFVGRLRAVNLDTHRLQVTDDVGNKVALPAVEDDSETGTMLDSYVEVVGVPEYEDGRLTRIHGAAVSPAAPLPSGVHAGSRSTTPVSDLVRGATDLPLTGIEGLTEEESTGFFEAIGL